MGNVPRNDRYLAMSHYVPLVSPLTCFYTLIKKIHDPFLFFHMKQGFALFIIWFFSVFVLALFPVFGWFVWVFLLALNIGGAYTSFHGEAVRIPLIYKLGEMLYLDKLYTQITGKKLS